MTAAARPMDPWCGTEQVEHVRRRTTITESLAQTIILQRMMLTDNAGSTNFSPWCVDMLLMPKASTVFSLKDWNHKTDASYSSPPSPSDPTTGGGWSAHGWRQTNGTEIGCFGVVFWLWNVLKVEHMGMCCVFTWVLFHMCSASFYVCKERSHASRCMKPVQMCVKRITST